MSGSYPHTHTQGIREMEGTTPIRKSVWAEIIRQLALFAFESVGAPGDPSGDWKDGALSGPARRISQSFCFPGNSET